MNKLLVAVLLFSSVFAISQDKATKPKAASGAPSVETMRKYTELWSKGPDAAAVLYDKSPNNVYFDISPLQYKGWAEYEPGVKQVLSGFESASLKLHDDTVHIHPSGHWAWGTAIYTLEGTEKNGNKVSQDLRWTVVWQKKGANWLIVHEHVSAPWSGPSGDRREK